MPRSRFMPVFVLLVSWAVSAVADKPAPLGGFTEVSKIGIDLYQALEGKKQQAINSRPIFIETSLVPSVRLVEYPGESNKLRAAFISVGFIDVINQLAHAKAIDRELEPGFLARYVEVLSRHDGKSRVPSAAPIGESRFWSEEVSNEQQSNFNQMVAAVLSIELSHFYNGNFEKYRSQLGSEESPVPLNSILPLEEWEETVEHGVRSALDAGLGVEGLLNLFEAFEKMPDRPTWTVYFYHPEARYKHLRRQLLEIESKFFSGRRE